METIISDIRFAARSLWKRPGFSAVVIITLALGIGANAAVFSIINAVLLRPLPYRDADRVVTIWQNNSKAGVAQNGSISYSTRQRTNEIGVRIALGAQSRDVLRLIVGQGIGLTLVGVVIGLGAALLLTRAIKSFLFGVSPTDPLTFLAISVLLLLTALIASLIPARRATKVDPLVALRSE